MAKLLLSHVRFCYGQQGQCFRALDDLNITIEEGEFICILGHSGCGKTTLLRLLSGLQDPTAGTVLLDGRPMAGPGPDRAVVFQNYALFPWMSAKKNVQFGIRQARQELPKAEVAALAMEYLTKVDMADAADKYPYQLSGGMRQRVAIARALAMDADICLLYTSCRCTYIGTRRRTIWRAWNGCTCWIASSAAPARTRARPRSISSRASAPASKSCGMPRRKPQIPEEVKVCWN